MSADEGELDDWLCNRCQANAITEVSLNLSLFWGSERKREVIKLYSLKVWLNHSTSHAAVSVF